MRSLESIFYLQACRTLHSIWFNMSPFQLATSVIARGYYNDRHCNRLFFVRHNSKKVGIHSFTNRLHLMTDDKNFEWLCLDPGEFDREIKERITCFWPGVNGPYSPNPFASTPLPFNLESQLLVYILVIFFYINYVLYAFLCHVKFHAQDKYSFTYIHKRIPYKSIQWVNSYKDYVGC